MASSSTSFVDKSFEYDVFLSFRGEDTRKSFIDHLYIALQQNNIHVYKDDESIKKGKSITDELIRSIENSRFYIIVFSKNYASSTWCLDELVKIMESQRTTEHTAYPIFYDVEPSEVRKQSGIVGQAFAKHNKEKSIVKWRESLREATDLAGWELKRTLDGYEARFIKKVVEEISFDLQRFKSTMDGKLLGMEIQATDVVSYLLTSFDVVRTIRNEGMRDGLKTILSRVAYNQITSQYFVENVKEVSKASFSGLKLLQKQVLSNLVSKKIVTMKGKT